MCTLDFGDERLGVKRTRGDSHDTQRVRARSADPRGCAPRVSDQRALKGKSDPVKIYNVVEVDAEATQFFVETGRHTIRGETIQKDYDPDFEVVLEHNGLEFSCRERDGEFIMGRAADCDLVVNEPCVSRETRDYPGAAGASVAD